MKNWLKVLVIVFIVAVAGVYIFIPRKIIVSKTILINCTRGGVERFLSAETNWERWWPSKGSANNDNNFTYKNRSYHIEQKLYNGVQIELQDNETKMTSKLHVVSLPNSSTAVEWVCEIDSSFNPIKKISDYQLGKKIQNDFTDILQSAKLFLEKEENVYGFSISQTSTTDTTLISTKSVFRGKPSTADIYNLIGTLKKYISQEGGKQTNHPLLNITALDSGRFQTMVAIPVNKPVKGNIAIRPKRMVPGKFLVSEIKGGEFAIDNAIKQMNLYVDDYSRSLVALPFQVMITDRQAETDTSKWVTQIYYPIY